MAYFGLRAASPLILTDGGWGGGGAVYPVQDCSPISEKHRLRKSSPFFEITWRGWTPCPCFQVDFSFDSFMGGSLGLPLQIGRRNSVKIIDIIEIQKCSIKKHQDFNSDFLITPPCLISLAAVFVSSRNAPPLER